ncbi:MAG: hypothetical protein AAF899_13120 [Pseudomonadota bacterium]
MSTPDITPADQPASDKQSSTQQSGDQQRSTQQSGGQQSSGQQGSGQQGSGTAPGDLTRRARDAAMALPVLGLFLLASPLTAAFAIEGRILGVPVVVVYVFAVWALLIYGAYQIGRRLTGATAQRRRGSG